MRNEVKSDRLEVRIRPSIKLKLISLCERENRSISDELEHLVRTRYDQLIRERSESNMKVFGDLNNDGVEVVRYVENGKDMIYIAGEDIRREYPYSKKKENELIAEAKSLIKCWEG